MSQFSPMTNLLLACLCALGLSPALGLPWYANAVQVKPTATKGSLELLADGMGRWFSSGGDTFSGTETLTGAKTALLVIGGVTLILCLVAMLPPLRGVARTGLRSVPLAAPAIVIVHLFNQPGSNAGTELRWGIFVTLLLSGFMASAAYQGAEIQDRKPAPKPYTPTYPK